VLQHQKPVPLADTVQPREVGRPSETVHDNDSRGPRSYGGLDAGRIEAVRRRIYLGEHRKRTGQDHGLGNLYVPEGRYDDLVTDADAGSPEHCSSTHAWMLSAERELLVTHSKKGLDPESKFRVQPFE
jgi:hypothetical protein